MRKTAAVVMGAALCATGLAACGGNNAHPAQSSAKGGGVFTTIDETHSITAGAPMNPYNAKGNSFDSYDQMSLGYTQNDSLHPNADYPGLAASWQKTATGLVVHIQPKAGWSDGKPVTAEDVKTSVAIAFAEGTQPSNLKSVTVMGPKEIAFNEQPGTKNQLFASEVLQTIIVPSSEYASQLPSDIWSTISASQGSGSAATKAKAVLGNVAKKIDTYAPKTDVAAGPFTIERINPGEALMVRNPHFFDASAVSPSEVVMRNYTGNEEIWTYLEGGELDAAPYTSMPTSVLKKILAVKGNVEKNSLAYTAASLAFDEKDYPYGITAVRQALAYALNRKQITAVGEAVSGKAAQTQTGMIDSAVASWLTPAQQKALNPYNYDPSKATKLLEGAHFTKKGGTWYLPDGKPWTMTIEAVSGFSDWIAAATYMAHELDSFGIQAKSAIASDYATYLSDIAAGHYAIGFWLNALGPAITDAFSRVWGANINAVGSTPSPSTSDFLHTPSTYHLAGIGTINPNTLTESLSNLTTAQAKPVVAKLAAAYDQELPMITLWDYRLVQFVNTKRFTDFPSSEGLLDNPPGVWMWSGYVHGK
jgi:peptide/nickel transport system substrate-binding protein